MEQERNMKLVEGLQRVIDSIQSVKIDASYTNMALMLNAIQALCGIRDELKRKSNPEENQNGTDE